MYQSSSYISTSVDLSEEMKGEKDNMTEIPAYTVHSLQ